MVSTARLPPMSACSSSSYPTSDDDNDDDVAPTFVASLSSFGQASREGRPFVWLLFIIWPPKEPPNQSLLKISDQDDDDVDSDGGSVSVLKNTTSASKAWG